MKNSRMVIIDIGSGYENEFFGKDLAETNAPVSALMKAEAWVSELKDGVCATEEFIAYIKRNGYEINMINSLVDIEVYLASNENF